VHFHGFKYSNRRKHYTEKFVHVRDGNNEEFSHEILDDVND